MLRLTKRNSTLKTVKELDAFPKVPDSYKLSTASGGTVSIIGYIVILILGISEIRNYSSYDVKFKYDIDSDFDSKIKINIDVTVAMPCDAIGADVMDVTNQNARVQGKLQEHNVVFELSDSQRIYWDTMQKLNSYVREQYHSVQDILWKEGYVGLLKGFPSGELGQNKPPDGCRVHGTLIVNKVSGNFHITAGKHLPHPAGHAHISMFLRDEDYNFSHRIEGLSFGEPHNGLFDPLEGDEKTAPTNFHIYQYYIKVVPTEIFIDGDKISTYQYSVTEQDRPINHGKGSHGVSGIYFKYDVSPIKVQVKKERVSLLWHLLVRLGGILGGVFATTGAINHLVSIIADIVASKLYGSNSLKTKATIGSVIPGLTTNILPSLPSANLPTEETFYSNLETTNFPLQSPLNSNGLFNEENATASQSSAS